MKLKALVTPDFRNSHHDSEGYPRPYGRFTEIGRSDKGMTIEFEATRLDVLSDYAGSAITEKNAKAVWAEVRNEFVGKVGFRMYGGILSTILRRLDHGFSTVYDFLYEQKGLGFMGGTGCGTKVHHLTYDVATGVKDGLDPLVTEVAQAWFNLMMGELKYFRRETKHLRDNIGEAELVLTFNAHPTCQKTVRYVGAKGYPLRNAKVTCAKCAKGGHHV